MEAGFSKSSLINIIDNPTDKEIVRELCLAALAQGKKHIPEVMIQSAYNSRKPSLLNSIKWGFFKTVYFLVTQHKGFIQFRASPTFTCTWNEMPTITFQHNLDVPSWQTFIGEILKHLENIYIRNKDFNGGSSIFHKYTFTSCWRMQKQFYKCHVDYLTFPDISSTGQTMYFSVYIVSSALPVLRTKSTNNFIF